MSQHYAILKARKYAKEYALKERDWWNGERVVKVTQGKEVSNEIIWEGMLSSPHLEVNEQFYIKELEVSVYIVSIMRSTDGSVIYQTDYEFELVEDDNTKITKLQAETELLQHEVWLSQRKVEEFCEPVSKKNWFQRSFKQ